ncbi:xanthine phosphoribosyltransferase [Desulfovibrio inopinatus]|uniref:xanthine phosphoribosyltransferase n=1 Tax=Desulfovibrio inopinatus TaxID=102109 RepID=UPI0004014162|nr:xanthine phosphoribosyltransferase [Desulfovibrio inopinatus]
MSEADRYKKMYPVSWDQLHRDCRALTWRLVDRKWKGILAITRGGLIPAAIIARELDIHLIDTVCISTYNWLEQTKEISILKSFTADSTGWLLVDDLVDTGKTASIVREMVPHAYFATVYAKPQGRPLVDAFVTEVSQDTWILFPWDSQPQFIEPIYQTTGHSS